MGSVYLWENRAAAEGFYNEEWRKFVAEKYGGAPEIHYFETPVIVDNPSQEIIVEAAA